MGGNKWILSRIEDSRMKILKTWEDKGPCAEPATATIRKDVEVDGSGDTPCYAMCVRIFVSCSLELPVLKSTYPSLDIVRSRV